MANMVMANIKIDMSELRDSINDTTSFFYTILRDHMVSGDIEKILGEIEKYRDQEKVYSNDHLAVYSSHLACRLLGIDPEKIK